MAGAAGAAVFAAASAAGAAGTAACGAAAMLADDIVIAAAANAIAHPVRFILTPKIGLQDGAPWIGVPVKSAAL